MAPMLAMVSTAAMDRSRIGIPFLFGRAIGDVRMLMLPV
jgi:hypothetical protein